MPIRSYYMSILMYRAETWMWTKAGSRFTGRDVKFLRNTER
jgi:hypothetical protein